MTDPSQMPRWAADILRSTCESAAATLAAHGHLDADAAREFVSGLAAGFEVDADDVACALGLDDLEIGDPPVGTRPPAEDNPPWLDLVEPPPGYQLAAIMAGSPAAHAAGSYLSDLEDAPIGWAWARPGEAIVDAAARAEGGEGKGELCGDEAAAHAAAWADHQLAALPPGFVLRDTSYDDFGDDGEVLGDLMGRVSRWEWSDGECSDTGSTEAEARADAWEFFHEQGAATVHDLLLLVGVWPEDAADDAALAARLEWIRGWSLLERGQVARWAATSHVAASDHDDVQVPARPACLDCGRPA